MKKLLAVLAAGVLLSACATHSTPQYVPCRVEQVPRPTFPFDRLQLGADIHTQVKTLLADREERKGYEVKLEAANRACP